MNLQTFLAELTQNEDAQTVADRCGVTRAAVRRWRAKRGFRPPARATLERIFTAYSVSLADQRAAMDALERIRSGQLRGEQGH